MTLLHVPTAVPIAILGWIGRQGTRAVAVSIFIGLALPPLAALLRPIFAETLFVMLCLAFLRVDPAAARRHVARPRLILAVVLWMMVAVPLIAALALRIFGVGDPALILALTLQTAAPPIVASPALAALMGLDAALSLVGMIACTAVAPLTASGFAYVFLGAAAPLTPLALGLKLFVMLAGAALAAALIRRGAGQSRIERHRDAIDGLNVIALFVFAVAFMDGVPAHAMADPRQVAALLLFAFAVTFALGAATALVFAPAGRSAALALAVGSGCRNMGLMLAAAGSVPDGAWLYMALAQFPIYLLPHLLTRRARRGGADRSRCRTK
jgi:hypothetical protein